MKLRLVLLTIACAGLSCAANLVLNSGFESGGADWNSAGVTFYPTIGGSFVHSGSGAVNSVCASQPACLSTGGGGSWVGQSVSTTAGQSYDLSLWAGEYGGGNILIDVYWNGVDQQRFFNFSSAALGSGGSFVPLTVSGLVATGFGRSDGGRRIARRKQLPDGSRRRPGTGDLRPDSSPAGFRRPPWPRSPQITAIHEAADTPGTAHRRTRLIHVTVTARVEALCWNRSMETSG